MSPFTEARYDVAVGCNEVAVITRLKGFNQDGINVTMECERDLAVSRTGADKKPAHIISI